MNKLLKLLIVSMLMLFVPGVAYAVSFETFEWHGDIPQIDSEGNVYYTKHMIYNGDKIKYGNENFSCVKVDEYTKRIWGVFLGQGKGNIGYYDIEAHQLVDTGFEVSPMLYLPNFFIRPDNMPDFYSLGNHYRYEDGQYKLIFKGNAADENNFCAIKTTVDSQNNIWAFGKDTSKDDYLVKRYQNGQYVSVVDALYRTTGISKADEFEVIYADNRTYLYLIQQDIMRQLEITLEYAQYPKYNSKQFSAHPGDNRILKRNGDSLILVTKDSSTSTSIMYSVTGNNPKTETIINTGPSGNIIAVDIPINDAKYIYYKIGGITYVSVTDSIQYEISSILTYISMGKTKAAAEAAAQAAAEASATASATATAVAESAKVTNAPLITQFQVNGGALEKEGTGIVKAIFRAQNSPTDTGWNKIQYRITRVNSTGTETELVDWTNFDVMLFSRGEADIQPIAGMNNLILYVKNTTSGAISKANTTLIAGTISDRDPALESYYGGMYGITKESRDYAGYAAIMADEAKGYASDAYSTVTNSTYGLSALKSLIDTVNGVADDAKTAASNSFTSVKSGDKSAIGVLTDTTKGLTQTYDKANAAATNASAAATNSSTAASSANTAASRALTTINNTQADDGGTTKSAAILAKEAKDNAGTAVTQLTSDTAGTIRADLTTAVDQTKYEGPIEALGGFEMELTAAQWSYLAANDAYSASQSAGASEYQTYDSIEEKSVTDIAKEARDKVNDVSTVVNTLSQAITPVIHSVKGQNGATCTTGTTFIVVTSASNATQYRARLSGGSWTSWGSNNTITVSVGSSTGPKTIEVQAKSSTGAIATDSITIFKI